MTTPDFDSMMNARLEELAAYKIAKAGE